LILALRQGVADRAFALAAASTPGQSSVVITCSIGVAALSPNRND